MSDSFLKIKVWTKLILMGLVAIFVLLFVYENYSYSATVWLFGKHEMTVLELLFLTFIFGVIATLLARPIYRTLGQIAELRKTKPDAAIPLAPKPPASAPAPKP
jgi:uncharacterized integral membrane protein